MVFEWKEFYAAAVIQRAVVQGKDGFSAESEGMDGGCVFCRVGRAAQQDFVFADTAASAEKAVVIAGQQDVFVRYGNDGDSAGTG